MPIRIARMKSPVNRVNGTPTPAEMSKSGAIALGFRAREPAESGRADATPEAFIDIYPHAA
jgi:hypothetical protein